MTGDIALTTSRISCAFYTEAPNNCEIYVSNSLLTIYSLVIRVSKNFIVKLFFLGNPGL